MTRNQKILLVVAGTLLVSCALLCIGAAFVLPRLLEDRVAQDPAQAKKVGAQIAEYTLPSGYEEQFGMDLAVTQMVVIAPRNDRGPVIMLMQYGAGNTSREEVEQQMRLVFQNRFQPGMSGFRQVGEQTVTIKGQPTALIISESSTDRGALRQAVGTFTGKGGLVSFMAMGTVQEWDQALLEEFLRSIR